MWLGGRRRAVRRGGGGRPSPPSVNPVPEIEKSKNVSSLNELHSRIPERNEAFKAIKESPWFKKQEEFTIKNADEIIFMKYGRVYERGCYEELMTSKGDYYNMVRFR